MIFFFPPENIAWLKNTQLQLFLGLNSNLQIFSVVWGGA